MASSFSQIFDSLWVERLVEQCTQTTATQAQSILQKTQWTLADLPVLLSPAMSPLLEELAQHAHRITQQRFGKTMQLFVPMYLANVCYNSCSYCGFSMENDYKRIVLSPDEILKEGLHLKQKGFQHLLLLTGEADKSSIQFIAEAIGLLRPHFASIGIEIQPLDTPDYHRMTQSGADSLTVYQETYHPEAYARYHTRGKKRNYTYRLDTPDRGGNAGFYRINIGTLMGLYEWRYEALALAQHLHYLSQTYWQNKYAVSFPRIQDMVGEFTPEHPISDRDFVQLICAFRLVFPDCGITLSTREAPALRDALIPLGITTMSAESNTAPGGYLGKEGTEQQFETADHRSLNEIMALLQLKGYEPVLKDWDPIHA